MDVWRAAHRASVRHLIAACFGDCGCTFDRLCDVGQILEDRVEDAERRMGLPRGEAASRLTDEWLEGQADAGSR